jgi:hypothetical protein
MPNINIPLNLITALASEEELDEADLSILQDCAKRAKMPHVPSTRAIEIVYAESTEGARVALFAQWAKEYFNLTECPGTEYCQIGCNKNKDQK